MTTSTVTSSGSQERQYDGGPRAGRMARWVVLAVVGALVVYGVCWLPSVVFHVTFQDLITTGDIGQRSGGMLNATVEEYRAPEGARPWSRLDFQDVSIPVPPGEVIERLEEGATLVVRYADGSVIIDRFRSDLLVGMILEELGRVGGKPSDLESVGLLPEGPTALERISTVTPDEYSFGMETPKRNVYAALVCSKLRLWELDDIEVASIFGTGDSRGVFMRSPEGSSKMVLSSPRGVFVYTISGLDLESLGNLADATAIELR